MLGDILGAVGKAVGFFGDKSNADKNRAQELALAQQNMAQQERFAKEGLRWKVDDARAAGIHPAFALGAQTASFSPVSISGGSDSNMSASLGSMGQDVGRAINATRTEEERVGAFETSVRRLQLEGAQLDNDIKRATLASSVQRIKQQSGPPMPSTGPEIQPLTMGGTKINMDKGWSNTEDATTRYGETADWWYGPQVMWADWNSHAGPGIRKEWPNTVRKFGRYMDYMRGRDSFDSRFKGGS